MLKPKLVGRTQKIYIKLTNKLTPLAHPITLYQIRDSNVHNKKKLTE